MLAGPKLVIKPFANVIADYTCCDGQCEGKKHFHYGSPPSLNRLGEVRQIQDTINSDKKQSKAPPYAFQSAGRYFLYNTL